MPVVVNVIVVVVVVMVGIMMVVVMRVVVVVVMVVMMASTVVTAKALAQSEFGSQLPDGLPLVQDGLLLPHETFPQM